MKSICHYYKRLINPEHLSWKHLCVVLVNVSNKNVFYNVSFLIIHFWKLCGQHLPLFPKCIWEYGGELPLSWVAAVFWWSNTHSTARSKVPASRPSNDKDNTFPIQDMRLGREPASSDVPMHVLTFMVVVIDLGVAGCSDLNERL